MFSASTGLPAGSRILVVEDDLLIAMDIEDVLETHGCLVIGPCGRLDQALAAVGPQIDGAIVDLNLRGENTFPLLDRLREHKVPTVVCSGYVELPEVRAKLAELPVLSKPCSPDKLVEVLSGSLAANRNAATPSD